MGRTPSPPSATSVLEKLRRRGYATRSIAKAQVTRALSGTVKEGRKRLLALELEEHYPLPLYTKKKQVFKVRTPEQQATLGESALPADDGAAAAVGEEQMDYDTLSRSYKYEKSMAATCRSTIDALRRELTDVRHTLSSIPGIPGITAPAMARAVVERLQKGDTVVKKDEIVLHVRGPSNSGKSTLIQLIQEGLEFYNIIFTMAGTSSEHLADAETQKRRLRAVAQSTHVTVVETTSYPSSWKR